MNFYSGLTQTIIVGFLAFCGPGMFNALNGLGGAGAASGNAGSVANVSLYACFTVFGYFGGAFFNLLGNKILMTVGGATYAVYAAGMYICGKKENFEWLAGVVGGLLGFGAGWFWTAQGAMMMAYATPQSKGRYISYFWMIFNLGGMIGGFITFALNFNAESGDASAASYFTFVGIMAAGAVAALFFLAPPQKVVREDNEPVVFEKAASPMEEIKGALSVSTHIPMLILTIPFIGSNWFYTYQFSGFNRYIFNTRTRGLNSALYWGAQMVGAFILGRMLDLKRFSRKQRGFISLTTTALVIALGWILGGIVQYVYKGGFEREVEPFGGYIDFKESRFAFPFIVYIIFGIMDAMYQTYAYWIMAALAGSDTQLCARYAGYYKGTQSLGAAVAWGIDLAIDYRPQFIVCVVICAISLPLMFYANYMLPDSDEEIAAAAEGGKEEAELPIVVEGQAPPAATFDIDPSRPVAVDNRAP